MKMTYEEILEQEGKLVYTNVGVSMLPLLREGKDLFVVERRGPNRLKVGDVALYRRPPDKYVLHRVVEVREKDYVILGDNCIAREYGIPEERILGVMTGYVRGGKYHSVTERGYRLYTWCVLHGEKPRIFLKKAVAYGKAVVKKVLGIQGRRHSV